jgi:hypothetical protein
MYILHPLNIFAKYTQAFFLFVSGNEILREKVIRQILKLTCLISCFRIFSTVNNLKPLCFFFNLVSATKFVSEFVRNVLRVCRKIIVP